LNGHSHIITISHGHHLWTRQVGTGPTPILTLHGGPGATHEYLEVLTAELPLDQYTLFFYDQLGSYYSDQPDDLNLWQVERFRDEVDEVRQALGLSRFVLFGQSWGGMLAIEYALAYPQHLSGLVISNMTYSIPDYVRYFNQLRQQLAPALQEEMARFESCADYFHPRYLEIMDILYGRHLCRLPKPWPAAVERSLSRINLDVYGTMQGPNEFVVTGRFQHWDRWDDLTQIDRQTLLLVGAHDTMDPASIRAMAARMPHAQAVVCPEGSHLAMWDDPAHYFPPLRAFLSGLVQR
jgi:proline iminopeptidase